MLIAGAGLGMVAVAPVVAGIGASVAGQLCSTERLKSNSRMT